jgi:putative NIF3 family GTP cyclohydrolase 1 type 2
MRIYDVEKYLYSLKDKLDPDEGELYGDSRKEVRGVQVCWMATLDAIKNAHKTGANLMLVHEALLSPYPFKKMPRPKDYLCWPANQKRIELLSKYGIAVMRFHGTLDEICIYDDFAKALELPQPTIVEKELVKLYDIEPVTIEAMIIKVKNNLGLDSVRVTCCNLKKRVHRIGLPWGGLGLFVNVSYQKKLLRYNPDLFIAGETDSYAMHFAIDSGVVMIETSHEVSENIGLKHFTTRLKKEIKNVPIIFYENKKPWINR